MPLLRLCFSAESKIYQAKIENMSKKLGQNIGFVGTRFAGTDGVSLEAAKWAQVLVCSGHSVHWFGGVLGTDPDVSMLVPHAFFGNPDIEWIHDRSFGTGRRSPDVTGRIYALSEHLKRSLYEFSNTYLLVCQNVYR